MILDEQVFRKMGWEDHITNYPEDGCYWKNKNTREVIASDELPPISSQWEVCAKYLVPFMRERGWSYWIEEFIMDIVFKWGNLELNTSYFVKIQNDNIAEVACKAFMEVEL